MLRLTALLFLTVTNAANYQSSYTRPQNSGNYQSSYTPPQNSGNYQSSYTPPQSSGYNRPSYNQPSYNNQPTLQGSSNAVQTSKLTNPVFQWRQIDYQDAPSKPSSGYASSYSSQRNAPQPLSVHDNYTAYNNVPMGTTRYKNKVFITMPRRRTGIPGTLNYVEYNGENGVKNEVKLTPYPDLKTNTFQMNPTGFQLVSVYRVRVDECNRLWFVDTGLLEYPGNPIRVQPAAIVVLDLQTGKLLHRYELPQEHVRDNSTLACIAVDIPNPSKCDEVFGYIPDLTSYAVIVYDMKNQRSWRIPDPSFRNEPENAHFIINNDLEYDWDDGIFSISLGPRDQYGYRLGYYHPMAGTHEYALNTRFLREESQSLRRSVDVVHLGDKGPRQHTSIGALDPDTGVLFYDLVYVNGLACWNTRKPFTRENHVVLFEDNDRFVYPSDTTIDGEGNLWVMTNTMPYFNYRSLNPENINFRVWRFNIRDLIRNTNCE